VPYVSPRKTGSIAIVNALDAHVNRGIRLLLHLGGFGLDESANLFEGVLEMSPLGCYILVNSIHSGIFPICDRAAPC
jgi:hypothetical protein